MSKILPLKEIFSSIQGEGECAGRRQIFIRMSGCNLTCYYCDTDYTAGAGCRIETFPGSGEFSLDNEQVSADRLIAIVTEWCHSKPSVHHSISITGGEPLLHTDVLKNLLPKLRALLPIYLETNGTLPESLKKLLACVDGISMDMKLPSTSRCGADLWSVHRDFLQIASAVNVSVKLVVSEVTGAEEILTCCHILEETKNGAPLFLQPLTRSDGTVSVSAKHLLSLQEAASRILSDVRVIPQMHLMLGAL